MAGLIFLWMQDGGVIPPDPPVIVLNPMGSSGDADDGFFAPVRRPNLEPQPEVIKKPYLQTLKEISKDEPEQKPKPKRKKFKEPEVIYKQPKPRPRSRAAVEPLVIKFESSTIPVPTERDIAMREQMRQAKLDRQRELREAEIKQQALAYEQERISRERAVRQDEEDAVLATLLLLDE